MTLVVFASPAACDAGDDGGSTSSSSAVADGDGAAEEQASGTGDFCDQVQELADADLVENFGDPEALAAAADSVEELSGSAPAELREDLEVLHGFLGLVLDNIEAISDPAQQEALQVEFADELAAVLEATANVNEVTVDECGLAIDGSTPADGSVEDDASDGAEDTSLDDFADGVAGCEAGDMAACDDLYHFTPAGSEAEAVALECGGEDPGGNHQGDCEATYG